MNEPIIPMDRAITLEDWERGRAARKRIGELVAPGSCRRKQSADDRRLRAAFGGERAPGRK